MIIVIEAPPWLLWMSQYRALELTGCYMDSADRWTGSGRQPARLITAEWVSAKMLRNKLFVCSTSSGLL